MIIDYKYHIASLVAVFLALGIGILIGSTLLGNNTVVEYQKQVTDRLESQLQALREDNEAIEARADNLEMNNNVNKQFEEQVMPLLVGDRLKDKRFAIVELNSFGFPPELAKVITDAGGSISSVTSLNTFYNEQKTLNELKQKLNRGDLGNDQLLNQLGTEIAIGIITGENKELIQLLAGMELLKKSGDYGIPVDGVIVVGGDYGENKRNIQIDLAVIDYFNELNIPVVGVEETDVSYSSMKEYQRKHISTVDNIDTAPGRLAMVFALSGKPGNYGIKSTAQRLLPDLNQQGVD